VRSTKVDDVSTKVDAGVEETHAGARKGDLDKPDTIGKAGGTWGISGAS
jgi:hypothetical protein